MLMNDDDDITKQISTAVIMCPMQVPAPGHLVGSGVVRIDPLCFLAGCRTR